MSEPESHEQTLGELALLKPSYHMFKKTLREASEIVSELFLIRGVLGETLTKLLVQGDTTSLETLKNNHKEAISFFTEEISRRPDHEHDLKGCIAMSENKIGTLEVDLRLGYESYCDFCDSVLIPMYDEKIEIPENFRKIALGEN